MFNESLRVPKRLYPVQVVLKATYAFIDTCYIHIGEDSDAWVIDMLQKDPDDNRPRIQELENELISQSVRWIVYRQTHVVRELLLARAMSSTMVVSADPKQPQQNEDDDISEEELDEILTSWFDAHE